LQCTQETIGVTSSQRTYHGFVSRQDNQASDDDLQLSPNSGEATRPDLGQESPRLQPVSEFS